MKFSIKPKSEFFFIQMAVQIQPITEIKSTMQIKKKNTTCKKPTMHIKSHNGSKPQLKSVVFFIFLILNKRHGLQVEKVQSFEM